jgi:transcriptional regulator with XRE-family HTH domain
MQGDPDRGGDTPPLDYSKLLGETLIERRQRASLTVSQAAALLGVCPAAVLEWERGKGSLWHGGPHGTVDFDLMARIRTAYGH